MPYQPNVSYVGDQYLAQGISSFGKSIAGAIEQSSAENKRLKALRTMATDYFKLDPTQVDALGAEEIEGKLKAHVMQQADAERVSLQKERDDQQKYRALQMFHTAEQMRRTNAQDVVTGNLLQNYGALQAPSYAPADLGQFWKPADQVPGPSVPGMNPAQALATALRTTRDPGLIDPNRLNVLADFARQSGTREQTPFFKPDQSSLPVEGIPDLRRVVTGPNTSQLWMTPGAGGNAVAITGPNGEDLGYGLPNRGGVKPLPTGQATDKDRFAQLHAEKRSLIAAEARAFMPEDKKGYKDRIAEIDQDLDALESQRQRKPTPAGNANITQGEYEKLKKGQKYWWNGQQLTKQ